MHPIMILMNAAFGPAGRRWSSKVLTAFVVLGVSAVAAALLLPGPYSAASTVGDPNLAALAPAPGSNWANRTAANELTDGQMEVRLKEWSYSAKPVTGATLSKK
jgi:hypothetical protein